MIQIEHVDPRNGRQVARFVEIPYRMFKGHPQWVPGFRMDMHRAIDPKKHAFYEHSEADFFIANRDGRDVGRIAVLENKRYNEYHGKRWANFYWFECEDDNEAADALFAKVFEWTKARGLEAVVGPKGFGPLDGYGILIDGFEHRQMMNMETYNPPYYQQLVERQGFTKENDFISYTANPEETDIPERLYRIVERLKERDNIRVIQFKNKRELIQWAPRIGYAYNNTFVKNWEYVPLTDGELKMVIDDLMLVAQPEMIKIVAQGDDVIGFTFAFPDVSAAMQRHNGRLFPFGILDLLWSLPRAEKVAVNGNGVLPQYQGRGANALLYVEIGKTLLANPHFKEAEFTQIAETADMMNADRDSLGGKRYKVHRVYRKDV